jgi:uncharacterized damage-inducible protein DinB
MAADPVKAPEAYKRELLELLGDRDPLNVMAHTPRLIEERLSDVDESVLTQRPAEGAWSVKEVLGHLSDTEWVYGYRARMMLSHEEPSIEGYDQDLMARGMNHNERPLSMLMEELRRLRGLNLDLYLRTRGPLWERVGRHSERGDESVDLMVRLLAGHDLRHMEQIERTLNQVRE